MDELIRWYLKHQRTLPWRENHDPYRIWISEIMLQQTQVVTVVDYYERFLIKYPDVFSLAGADEQDVLKLWEGLGYYSRARNLLRCAQIIVSDHKGVFPMNKAELLKLPGIGPYTSGAIASIAYNERVTAIDGNVMRVVARWERFDTDISKANAKKIFESYLLKNMPNDTRHFNQALMELGAIICTPKNPKCEVCPMHHMCKAYQFGDVSLYPVKSKRLFKKNQEMVMMVVHCRDEVLIFKQRDNLMKGLWVFPYIEVKESDSEVQMINASKEYLEDWLGLSTEFLKFGGQVTHIFTHLKWNIKMIHLTTPIPKDADYPKIMWTSYENLIDYPQPTLMKKVLMVL